MHTWTMMGPSGRMETTAPNMEKAWNNFRARLHFECGMSWADAALYDHSDIMMLR